MEFAQDIKGFLTTRRAKIAPEQVGLISGPRRRVAGLRREEVATLAGVSSEYYIQIERGKVAGVSDEVLQAIANALRLTEEETTHLFDLARAATAKSGGRKTSRQSSRQQVPPTIGLILESMAGSPALVQNPQLDIVAANALGRALYAPVFERATDAPNLARFLFLDAHAEDTFPAWSKSADDAVALLHFAAARTPYASAITNLVGELATRSDEFRTRWAAHDVRAHRRGVKRFRHDVVGEVTLSYEALEIDGPGGLSLVAYAAEPGSADDEALRLLASWSSAPKSGSVSH
ncbi:helix-turn-helix transcriptional regulator [Gordonia sp. TBRC 11910]|uniref:Helix-turn-helix transcriptional regulator n=1 Tax=Gordonia asplenii TaxID=2725283 RepID=A0A848KY04_9ACTN|nr:helix-turn-helix transcriptional regulator [Gordonia asplenii]NMO03229.1 helix-turn-helix transcriptional regulator [Gordonia asplenii]